MQRVEFENGVANTVNFGDRPFRMKDGRILPPRDFLVEGFRADDPKE